MTEKKKRNSRRNMHFINTLPPQTSSPQSPAKKRKTSSSTSPAFINEPLDSPSTSPSTSIHDVCPNGDILMTVTTSDPPTLLRVSSTHLRLISPYYEALLRSDLSEGRSFRAHNAQAQAQPQGQHPTLHLTYHDISAQAMLLVMNAAHGKHWAVPSRGLRLALLNDIAVIVDRFLLHEAVCTLAYTWIRTCRVGGEDEDEEETPAMVAQWMICVAWVFDLHADFEAMTGSLVVDEIAEECFGGSCVPVDVYETIFAKRRRLFAHIARALDAPIAKLVQSRRRLIFSNEDDVFEQLRNVRDIAQKSRYRKTTAHTLKRSITSTLHVIRFKHDVDKNVRRDPYYRRPKSVTVLEELLGEVEEVWEREAAGLRLEEFKRLRSGGGDRTHWGGEMPRFDLDRLWPYEPDEMVVESLEGHAEECVGVYSSGSEDEEAG